MRSRPTRQTLRHLAAAAGIDRVTATPATALGDRAGLHRWLERGQHGTMRWMERAPERRLDPRRVLDGARTIVTVAVNYFRPFWHATRGDAGGAGGAGGGNAAAALTGRISRYAWGGDYHRIVRRRLVELARALGASRGAARLYVDTGPVMEKPWAHRSGLGWVGKHGNVITRQLGSWVFLGVLLLDEEIEPDPTATDHCGSCTRCIDACPTAAIVEPTVVDARRCISYLTIEHHGAIDPALRDGMGDWLFGCDVCQDVCPWNKFARPAADARFGPRAGNLAPSLVDLARLSQAAFDERFRGTNVRRSGWAGFLRNVMIALGNSGEPGPARAPLAAGLVHPEPLVRRHAAWALGRLGERAPLHARAARESDPTVHGEIEAALG